MKKAIRILFTLVFVFTLVMTMKSVHAESLLQSIFGGGGNFFKEGYNVQGDDFSKAFNSGLLNEDNFIGAIKAVGYTIFFVCGTILGLKFMWSGAEGKSMAKDGLVTYFLGVIFFYLGDQVFYFARDVLVDDLSKKTSYSSVEASIIGNLNLIVQMLAIGAVVFAGIRYMWSNSADKAQLKQSSITMVIGAVLTLCLTQVMNFVINVVDKEILPSNSVSIVQQVEMPEIQSTEYKL